MPPAVEAMVLELRRAHPYWGARRIAFELVRKRLEPAPSESAVYGSADRHQLPNFEARTTIAHPVTQNPVSPMTITFTGTLTAAITTATIPKVRPSARWGELDWLVEARMRTLAPPAASAIVIAINNTSAKPDALQLPSPDITPINSRIGSATTVALPTATAIAARSEVTNDCCCKAGSAASGSAGERQ